MNLGIINLDSEKAFLSSCYDGEVSIEHAELLNNSIICRLVVPRGNIICVCTSYCESLRYLSSLFLKRYAYFVGMDFKGRKTETSIIKGFIKEINLSLPPPY